MSVLYAPARWPAAVVTVGLWVLAAASIVFWGLRLGAPSDTVPPPAVSRAPQVVAEPAAVAQMLGAVSAQPTVAATPDAAARFELLGVVADVDQQGAALIAVDGKPARPFRVGAKVVDGYVLQSLGTRSAAIGGSADSAPAFTLQLPTRPLALPAPLPPSQAMPVSPTPVVAPTMMPPPLNRPSPQ